MSKGGTTRIEDALLEPYFIKIVNGNYEIHRKHVPKDETKKPYEKFVSVKTTMLNAIGSIAKHKLSVKRRTKKVIALSEYVSEIREMRKLIMLFVDEDSPEKKIVKLENKISLLEAEIKSIKSSVNDIKVANSGLDIIL